VDAKEYNYARMSSICTFFYRKQNLVTRFQEVLDACEPRCIFN